MYDGITPVKAGFTLPELLVALAVVAVLIAIGIPATSRIKGYNSRTKSISNLRQIGVAAHLYALDHNQRLPGQPGSANPLSPGGRSAEWPTLFCAYLSPSDPSVFLDPGDASTARLPVAQILSDTQNNTAFVYNGFDDLAVDNAPPTSVSLPSLAAPANTVLLAQKTRGATAFFVSPLFQPISSLGSLLDPSAYDGGSHYLFVDGSVRFIKQSDYSNDFWLADKSSNLPFPPLNNAPNGPFNNGSNNKLAVILF